VTADRPRSVLFATPVPPALRGNGLAMRAGASLRLLLEAGHAVHLVVVPLYGGDLSSLDPALGKRCASVACMPLPTARKGISAFLRKLFKHRHRKNDIPKEWASCTDAWKKAVETESKKRPHDLLFLFRFSLLPFFDSPLFSPSRWLDLDELESRSRSRLAGLHSLNGNHAEARQLRREADACAELEKKHLHRFEKIFTASDEEAAHIRSTIPSLPVHPLPNIYPDLPPCPPRISIGAFRLLFVGSFGHFPNRDAVLHFSRDILPLVRSRLSLPVELHVAGAGSEHAFGSGDDKAGFFVHGQVADLFPLYEASDLAIVPLRAGGGSRIKILEAFCHDRAVVSTQVGAEGLEVLSENHLWIGSSPEDFAAGCVRLLQDDRLRSNIARNGRRFFETHHAFSALQSAFRKAAAP
jgi:glycosyltransferase involved in cell wall biosynthesis